MEKKHSHACPVCDGTGLVPIRFDLDKCEYCYAESRFTSVLGHSYETRVQGSDAKEVLKVVRTIMNDAKAFSGTINISGGTIGMLNTGTMQNIQSISTNVAALEEHDASDVAEALKALTE